MPPILSEFEPSSAMIDPETGETYWRVKSRDGTINYTITERAARLQRWAGVHNCLKATCWCLGLTAITFFVCVVCFGLYNSATFLPPGIFAICVPMFLFLALVAALLALSNTTFNQTFI